jgi:hypothetical protein
LYETYVESVLGYFINNAGFEEHPRYPPDLWHNWLIVELYIVDSECKLFFSAIYLFI